MGYIYIVYKFVIWKASGIFQWTFEKAFSSFKCRIRSLHSTDLVMLYLELILPPSVNPIAVNKCINIKTGSGSFCNWQEFVNSSGVSEVVGHQNWPLLIPVSCYFFPLRHNIFLDALFSNTLSLRSSLREIDQVSNHIKHRQHIHWRLRS
jgi:hypothetical protein